MKAWICFGICVVLLVVAVGFLFHNAFSDNVKENHSEKSNSKQKPDNRQTNKVVQFPDTKKHIVETDKHEEAIEITDKNDNQTKPNEPINKTSSVKSPIKKTDWSKYKAKRDSLSNLDSRYKQTIAKILGKIPLTSTDYIFDAADRDFLDKLLNYALNTFNPREDRVQILIMLNKTHNREIAETFLPALSSDDFTNINAALTYFTSNIFPEYGDEIVTRIVENADNTYRYWFHTQSKIIFTDCVFQIFSYYVNKANIPKFLKAYEYSNTQTKQIKNASFNAFFAGITSYVPLDKRIEDATLEDWKNFYAENPDKMTGLQRDNNDKIKALPPTGEMKTYHESFQTKVMTSLTSYYGWYVRCLRYSEKSKERNPLHPYYLTFAPYVLDNASDDSGLTGSYTDRKINLRQSYSFNFLADAGQTIYAKEICEIGLKKLEKTHKFFCRYFSRVGNQDGYGLKYAIAFLKGKYQIDEEAMNMIVAIDEPELIEYLMNYKTYKEISYIWATCMVRLTRHTFGSLADNMSWANWFVYLRDNDIYEYSYD